MSVRPELFTWNRVARPRPLREWQVAEDGYGFYELGVVRGGHFKPTYGGRASGTTLRQRLRQHWTRSHNPEVRRSRESLWFRCVSLPSPECARRVEAHYLAAFDLYEWNNRQEWREHFA